MRRSFPRQFLTLLPTGLVLALPALVLGGSGDDFVRTATLSGDYSGLPAQTAARGPEFGYSVAISGDWLVVGAPGTIVDGNFYGVAEHGAVFVFRREHGWQLHQRITFPYYGSAARCGYSVALAPPHLAIGCPGAGSSAAPAGEHGLVVLRRLHADGLWQQAGADLGQTGARCGRAIALNALGSDDPAVVAFGCPGWSNNTGRVWVDRYVPASGLWSGNHVAVTASDASSGDRYGESLALYRAMAGAITVQRLAIGAPYKTHGPALAAGSVYVHSGSDWSQTAVLTGPSPQNFALTYFGSDVAMNNTQLVVGARGGLTFKCGNVPRCGTVTRFQRSGANWLLQEGGGAVNAGGNPPGEQPGMEFGDRVAIGADNWVAVAAPRTDGWTQFNGVAEDVGLVELRRADDGGWGVSWNQAQGEVRPGVIGALALAEGHFGHGLNFGGRRLAVGYPGAGTTVPGSGRRGQVWIYEPDRIFADGFE